MALIGIDLGTTNSALAYLRGNPEIIQIGGSPTMPSAIGWDDENQTLVFGKKAKGNPKYRPVVSVKRSMGTDATFTVGPHTFKPHEISAHYLKEIVKAAEERLEEPVDGAVITTPAYFGDPQNRATLKAAEEAGLKNVQLLAEPLAAALSYGLDNDNDVILVYDLGGGTFDVSVIDCFDFQMKGLAGNNRLGGDDFDNRLIDFLVGEIQNSQGVNIRESDEAMGLAHAACEQAKIKLSTDDSTMLQFMCEVDGKPVMYMGEVTRAQFEEMIGDLVDSTIEKIKEAITNCQEDDDRFTKEDINRVLLVGGSTYVPLVQKRVSDFFGMEPSKRVDQDLAVAMGAAVKTATMQESEAARDEIRVQLDPLPDVTNRDSVTVAGRTNPGASVALTNGGTARQCVADDRGRFSTEIELEKNRANTVEAKVEMNGETRKAVVDVRHDSGFSGEEKVPRTGDGGTVAGKQPRPVGVSLTAQNNLFRPIIQANRDLPCQDFGDGIGVSAGPNGGGARIIVCEGNNPHSLFNTIIGEAVLSVPPCQEPQLPVEITLRVDENRTVFLEASLPDYPDRVVNARFEQKETDPEKFALDERVNDFLQTYGNQIKPEEKARLQEPFSALKDLMAAFNPNDDEKSPTYGRLVETGNRLLPIIRDLEQRYQRGHS